MLSKPLLFHIIFKISQNSPLYEGGLVKLLELLQHGQTGHNVTESGKMKKKLLRAALTVIVLTFIGVPTTSHAGFTFLDPGIPSGEKIMYQSKSEGRTMTMEEQIVTTLEGDKLYYDISSLSPVLDTYIRVDRENMTVLSVKTVQKYETATLDSTLLIKDQQPGSKNDEVKVPHFVALTHLLRGFPFESRKKLRICYYGGAAKNKFTLCIRYKKREFIQAGGREIECHKLEFGLDGLWGTFLPELELWYSVTPPHYMVRYKGPEGPPGTPERFIELMEYTSP